MVDQRRFDDQRSTLDAAAAAELLGVDRRTLYAYVARGLVRSFPGPQGRRRQYAREDLDRLAARSRARGGHGAVAAGALRFGEAVLDSAITAVEPGGIRYRGTPLAELLRRREPFERVAELLWTGALPASQEPWEALPVPWTRLRALVRDRSPLAALGLVVAALAAADPDAAVDDGRASLEQARRVVRTLAVALAPGFGSEAVGRATRERTLAGACAAALGCGRSAEQRAAIELTLVASADHELNASTFAARIAASTGAGLFACVAAAIGVLSGPRHGAAPLRVEALVDAIGRPARAAALVRQRVRSGEAIPGFGHPLYHDGDPRAAPLLGAAEALAPRSPRVRTLLALVRAMAAAGRDAPNLDVGLAAVAAALALPRGAASGLFAVGRSAGWIAHVLEQRKSDLVLRPRARSVGR
jgi:citrate synthase